MRVKYLGYDEIYRMLLEYGVGYFEKFDRIIGIGRAGAIIGGMIATMVDKKFSYMSIDSEGNVKVSPEPSENEFVLLVDDVLATGKTIKSAEEYVKRKGNEYDVFVIVDGYDRAKYRPDKYGFVIRASSNEWILFPWDLIDFVRGERLSYSRNRVEV